MISILWKIFIILHGNSCMSKGLDYGGIHFEKRSSEDNLKDKKIKISSNLKKFGTRTIFFLRYELKLYIKFRWTLFLEEWLTVWVRVRCDTYILFTNCISKSPCVRIQLNFSSFIKYIRQLSSVLTSMWLDGWRALYSIDNCRVVIDRIVVFKYRVAESGFWARWKKIFSGSQQGRTG